MNDKTFNSFDKPYVLKVTASHMRKAIDISIRKTFERIKEFDNDSAKSREIIETLSVLHTMRRNLDDFQLANRAEFRGEK
jgi:hypothetical protein